MRKGCKGHTSALVKLQVLAMVNLIAGIMAPAAQAGGPHMCCKADGTCANTPACNFDCTYCVTGSLCSAGTDCTIGACCNGATCQEIPKIQCDSINGAVYQGPGTTCSPDNPCTGACCQGDGSCQETAELDCGGSFQGSASNCDPNICPVPTGACCGGSLEQCTELVQADCTAAGGTYAGDGTSCFTNPCTGACCEESCQVVTREECFFGWYLGDTTACSEDICLGGCCEFDGSCMDGVFTPLECSNRDGRFISPGTTCTEELCAPLTGHACCFEDGSCQDLPKIQCDAKNGSFHSDDIDCSPGDCPQPQACCFPDASCRELTVNTCYHENGLTQSVSCDPNPCLLPPKNDTCLGAIPLHVGESLQGSNAFATDDVTTACQFSISESGVWYSVAGNGEILTVTTCNGGTLINTVIKVFCDCESLACVEGTYDSNCGAVSRASWCSQVGKTYYVMVGGYGSNANGNFEVSLSSNGSLCAFPACSVPSHACCFQFGCFEYPPAQCEAFGGIAQAAGTTCLTYDCPVLAENAACCDGANCYDGIYQSTCDELIHGKFLGNGSTCATVACDTPVGACCISTGRCEIHTEANCPGVYQGDSTTCDPNLCPQPMGACCLPDFTCTASQTPSKCLGQGGTYLGHNSTCTADSCSPAPTGACCDTSGGCGTNTAVGCQVGGGTYQGDNLACDGLTCALGACCLDATDFPPCGRTFQNSCAGFGGTYQGDGSECSPNPCTGACCLMGLCFDTTEADCGGSYQGDGTSCGGDPCFEPQGSCCLPDGTCEITTAFNCTIGYQGDFRDDGTYCAEPCPVRHIVSSEPAHCTIDARIPSAPGRPKERRGFQSIELTFDDLAGPAEDGAEDYTVSQVPASVPPDPPQITSVEILGSGATIHFNTPIHPGRWTCVKHNASGEQRCLGYLPADVNSNRFAGPADILDIVDNLNGVRNPPLQMHQCDIDRSNLCGPADILSEVDLLNGVTQFPVANGTRLTACPATGP